ncbi:hypothetical protein F4809DRAFT_659874 [Biscogniauxia mediterranea]|nr:hypothetical protein F4809DRAFT_659874 [Biscogniauxia mediterranea]
MASNGNKEITSGATTPATVPPNSPRPQHKNTGEEVFNACIMCDKKASLRCPTCGTWYCRRECYIRDWPLHKNLCNSLKGDLYHDSKRPPHHVRGILFPPNSPVPTFAWLDKRAMRRAISVAFGFDAAAGTRGEVMIASQRIDGVHRRNRRHKDNTSICALYGKAVKINQAMLALSKPGHMMIAYGPLAFCCCNTAKEQSESTDLDDYDWVDATLGSFRDIVDFQRHLEINPCIVDPVRFPFADHSGANFEAKIWPAVKINCEGDIMRLSPFYGEERKLPLAEEVSVLSVDYFGRLTCHLPQLAGLPWVMQDCTSTNLTLKEEERHNYGGRVFVPEAKLSSPETVIAGEVLPATHCGSIIVLHKEGAPIQVSHVLCFFDFIEVQLRQATMKTRGVLEPGTHRVLLTREQLESRVTKERFLEYWMHWVEDKSRDAQHKISYNDLRSPYDFMEMEKDRKALADVMRNLEILGKKENEQALADAKRDLGMH